MKLTFPASYLNKMSIVMPTANYPNKLTRKTSYKDLDLYGIHNIPSIIKKRCDSVYSKGLAFGMYIQ